MSTVILNTMDLHSLKNDFRCAKCGKMVKNAKLIKIEDLLPFTELAELVESRDDLKITIHNKTEERCIPCYEKMKDDC